MAQNPQVTQPNNIPNNGIPTSAGPAPAGMVPTFGAAGIFTGYAAAPTQNVNVGGQSTPITKPVTTPPSPVAPQTAPVSSPAPTSSSPSAPTQQQSNTQFYYTQTKDASGKNVTTYYDGNGNVLPTNPIGGDQFKDNPQGTPNAGNNLVQLPAGSSLPSGESPDQLNGDIQTSTQNYTTELDNLNSESDKAFTQYESQLGQIENGTFPLTPAQQSLLDATKQQIDILRQQQMTANNAYLQGTETLQGRTGLTSGGTQTAMGTVENAINSGIQKLSALDAQGAETLATLEKGFETDDLQLINDSYDAYQKYETQKEATLKDIQSATISAAQDQRDFTYKQTQDNIQNILNQQKETFAEKDEAVKNALAQSQLDEKTKADLRSEAIQQEVANNGRYEVVTNAVDGTQSIFDKSTGEMVGTPTGSVVNGQLSGANAQGQPLSIGNTGIPLLDNNTKTSVSGVPFVDGTNLTGKQSAAAQEDAAKLGVPYLGKTQSAAIQNADTARINMSNISNSLQGLLAANAVTRVAVGPFNLLSQFFQSNDQLSSFNAYRSAAIEALRAMAGSTGLRINQAEILQSVNQDIPKITDTVGTAQAKIAKVTSMLDSQERGLFGPQYDVMKSQSTANPLQSFYSASPQDAKVITTLKTQFPNYSDDEIMQVVRGLGANLYSSMGIQYNQ